MHRADLTAEETRAHGEFLYEVVHLENRRYR